MSREEPPAGPSGPGASEGGGSPLGRFVVILHEPRDLVNVALVVRAMRNMELDRLRVVRPAEEFDRYRIEGIAHGTEELVAATELPGSLDAALADITYVVGTSARRRSSRQQWWGVGEAARRLVERERPGDVALLFGPEDRGLSNEELDRCHAVVRIPTNPEHPSLNLAHAALIVFWELRKAAGEAGGEVGGEPAGLPGPDLSPKRRRRAPPATAEELEALFGVWEKALEEVGFFHHIDPLPKMRSFRSIFQRADLDRRELGLLRAAAYEILHFARRTRIRLRKELEGKAGG